MSGDETFLKLHSVDAVSFACLATQLSGNAILRDEVILQYPGDFCQLVSISRTIDNGGPYNYLA